MSNPYAEEFRESQSEAIKNLETEKAMLEAAFKAKEAEADELKQKLKSIHKQILTHNRILGNKKQTADDFMADFVLDGPKTRQEILDAVRVKYPYITLNDAMGRLMFAIRNKVLVEVSPNVFQKGEGKSEIKVCLKDRTLEILKEKGKCLLVELCSALDKEGFNASSVRAGIYASHKIKRFKNEFGQTFVEYADVS